MIEKEIRATIYGKEDVNGVIYLEPLRGPNGYSAYELYVKNLPEGEKPLSEKEWLDGLDKANYYKQYKSTYTVSQDGETIIPININEYNSTCLLEVYIEGFILKEAIDYTINSDLKNITLALPLKKDTIVHFVCSKTVVATANDYDLLRGTDGIDVTSATSGTPIQSNDYTVTPITFNKSDNTAVTVNVQAKNGINGEGVPDGGTTGQVLAKASDTDGDVEWVNQTGGSPDYDSAPVGAIFGYPSLTPPTGYMVCDGSELSRTEYASLFEVIGTSYGVGDGSTTFNIPNIKGRVIVGHNISDSDFSSLGNTGGSKTHTQTVSEMARHTHVLKKGVAVGGDGSGLAYSGTTVSNNAGVEPAGESEPMDVMNPYIVACYIIKVSGTAILNGNVVDNLTENSTTNSPSQNAVNQGLISINNFIGDLFKFQTLSVPIEIAGNGHASFQMGWLDEAEEYSYLGILSKESGFGDQWTITYSLYQGNKIYADVRNNYSQTLSSSITCTVVYIKSDYLTKAIVGDENETE